MKKARLIVFVFIFFIAVFILEYSRAQITEPDKPKEDCINETFQEIQHIIEKGVIQLTKKVCSDEPINLSCSLIVYDTKSYERETGGYIYYANKTTCK